MGVLSRPDPTGASKKLGQESVILVTDHCDRRYSDPGSSTQTERQVPTRKSHDSFAQLRSNCLLRHHHFRDLCLDQGRDVRSHPSSWPFADGHRPANGHNMLSLGITVGGPAYSHRQYRRRALELGAD